MLTLLLMQCTTQRAAVPSSGRAVPKAWTVAADKSVTPDHSAAVRPPVPPAAPVVGAAQPALYMPRLRGLRVVLVVNQTARVGRRHLLDTLRAAGVNVIRILAPEHGFRGTEDAGKAVADSVDGATGLPVASLYGATKKPTARHLADADVLVFDIQDVGARFYTYLSTLHYVLEACAEQHKPLLVLDRPNPNGDYCDGPVLEPDCRSFVGLDPLPIVHGLTLGEAAQMMNGEGWLANGVRAELSVIPVAHYTHRTPYALPVAPSPNLRTARAIRLYPTLCLFEGTGVSVGRGTVTPFEVVGHPAYPDTAFHFTPRPGPANAAPLLANRRCFGRDLSTAVAPVAPSFTLTYLLEFYQKMPDRSRFFNNFFDKLAGTHELRRQIEAGLDETAIRASWAPKLTAYRALRKKYLLYAE